MKNKKGIAAILFLYWLVLVLWLNISAVENQSGLDILIKCGLIGLLSFYYILHMDGKLYHVITFPLFTLSLIISFSLEKGYGFRTIVYYLFVLMLIFCVYVIGNKHCITVQNYIWFLNAIILVAVYTAIYALLFCTEQFVSAFEISNAYGHELSSFFSSNHEYGMYMAAGIIGCVFNIEQNVDNNKKGNVKYILALLILVPNLILTFSRTAIFSALIFFFMYILLGNNKIMKRTLVFLMIVGMTIALYSGTIRNFLINIVGKGGNSAGRDKLYDLAIRLFRESGTFHKLFGNGIVLSQEYFEAATTHSNVHNAYLHVLVCFGIVGLAWMVGFLLKLLIGYWRFYLRNKMWGARFLCITLWSIFMMIANTHLIFTSQIDCYFLTMFAIIVPKYVYNALCKKETVFFEQGGREGNIDEQNRDFI
jgi:O-antigen ligase